MSPGHEAYDAGLTAVALGLRLLTQRGEEGQDFTLFTDSQAAMRRVASDAPGPGQEIAVEVLRFSRQLIAQGNTITIRWVPSHRGVEGNEQADQRAGVVADLADFPLPRSTTQRYILAFLSAGQPSRPPRGGGRTSRGGTLAGGPLGYPRRVLGRSSDLDSAEPPRRWLRGVSSSCVDTL